MTVLHENNIINPLSEYIINNDGEKMVVLDEDNQILIKPLPKLVFQVYKYGNMVREFKGLKKCCIRTKNGKYINITEKYLLKIALTCGIIRYPSEKELFNKYMSMNPKSQLFKDINKVTIPLRLKLQQIPIKQFTINELFNIYEKQSKEDNLLENWLKNVVSTTKIAPNKEIFYNSSYLKLLMNILIVEPKQNNLLIKHCLRLILLEHLICRKEIKDFCTYKTDNIKETTILSDKYKLKNQDSIKIDVKQFNSPFKIIKKVNAYEYKYYYHIYSYNMVNNCYKVSEAIINKTEVKPRELLHYLIFEESLEVINDAKLYEVL